MSIYYYAIDPQNEHIFDNFPLNLHYTIDNYKDSPQPINIILNGTVFKARIGKKNNKYGTIYTLTTEAKYINKLKLFKDLLNQSLSYLEPFIKFQKSIIDQETKKTEELIHNLTSLNTYGIQDLFALISQEILSENINKQKDIIKNILIEKPNVTIETLLKLIKYNLAMKVEFSVFERTQKPNAAVKKIPHPIRSLILSVLQIFIDDFESKHIQVSLDAGTVSERRLEVDDDSLFVSLFYLLENSLKYCSPYTKYKIFFKEEENCFSVIFSMISIRIEDSEISKLTNFGYRSEAAKQINADGKGIGMYRIVKTLKLNNAELEITPRTIDFVRKSNGVTYEGNQFKIKFLGQPDWLKPIL